MWIPRVGLTFDNEGNTMKKVLLTSTALVAFAGAASAEVTISGSAEMGIVGGDGMETQFFQSVDARFSMSGETDGGLTFGATFDVEDAIDSGTTGSDMTDDTGFADYTIFISGSFGTVTMGDTDGALDWALTDQGNIGNPGSINDAETGHSGYLGSFLDGAYDGQIVRYDNTFGDFGVAVSVEMDDDSNTQGTTGNPADMGFAIGFRYSTDLGGADLALGLGYQSADGEGGATNRTYHGEVFESATGVGAVVTLDSGFTGGFTYTTFSAVTGGEDVDHLGIGLGYSMDAFSAHMNWGQFSKDGADDLTGWGLALGYDLGGGASILGGYGSSDNGTTTSDMWSVGLSMAF